MSTLLAHLKERKMYHPDVVLGDNKATMFLWNLSGQITGYHTYIPNAPKKGKHPKELRYYTYGHGVWGLQYAKSQDVILYLTEGIFDAVKLHNMGKNAIAVLGNIPKQLKSWLASLPYRTIAVCDGDVAGLKLAAVTDTAIYLPEGEDLGSLSYKEINSLVA